jgi:uncharacterized protein
VNDQHVPDDLSDERLNALIDGELAPADADAVLQRIGSDPALRERLAAAQLTKTLVRHAYADVPLPRPRELTPAAGRRQARMAKTAAAGLVALALGWVAHMQLADLDAAPTAIRPAASVAVAEGPLVVHVSTAAAARDAQTMSRVAALLQAAQREGNPDAVEIVANGGGLDLLRTDRSAYAEQLMQLLNTHPNLRLVACGQTVERLRQSGVEVALLPHTTIASSALDEIVLRMQQGFRYLQIS